MSTPTTPTVMPLEAAIAGLERILHHAATSHGEGSAHCLALRSALHHLEAGKRGKPSFRFLEESEPPQVGDLVMTWHLVLESERDIEEWKTWTMMRPTNTQGCELVDATYGASDPQTQEKGQG